MSPSPAPSRSERDEPTPDELPFNQWEYVAHIVTESEDEIDAFAAKYRVHNVVRVRSKMLKFWAFGHDGRYLFAIARRRPTSEGVLDARCTALPPAVVDHAWQCACGARFETRAGIAKHRGDVL